MAIRIVLLTLQECTTFTHMIITYRFRPRHRSRGASEDAHHNLYLTANLVHESHLPGLVTTIVNLAVLPKWTHTMCAWCESRSRLSRSLTWLPGHNTYQNSELLRHRRGWVSKLRGVSEPNVWLHSSSWITAQELGRKAVFNETTHCVLLHSLSSFTLY